MAPSWSLDGQVGAKMEPTWPQKRRVSSASPISTVHAPQPPSSDSSPLVKPLRVVQVTHRTPRQSQSFPEQKTRQLPASGRLLLRLLLRRDRCLLLRQDRCLLLRQDRCLLLKQEHLFCLTGRHLFQGSPGGSSLQPVDQKFILEHNRWRPAETGAVPGYGVKHPQTDPPHSCAKARVTAVKQTPSN